MKAAEMCEEGRLSEEAEHKNRFSLPGSAKVFQNHSSPKRAVNDTRYMVSRDGSGGTNSLYIMHTKTGDIGLSSAAVEESGRVNSNERSQ